MRNDRQSAAASDSALFLTPQATETCIAPRAPLDELRVALEAIKATQDLRRVEVVCHIGRLLADTLFGGIAAWRTRKRGDLSYARIARCQALPLSSNDLYRALRIYELRDRLGDLADSRLTLSHFMAVLGIESERQRALLAQAQHERWTVRQLQKVTAGTEGSQPRTGRPRTPAVVKTLESVLATEDAFDGIDDLLGLSKREAASLLQACQRARLGLDDAEQRLQQIVCRKARSRVVVLDPEHGLAPRVRSALRPQDLVVRVASTKQEAREMVDAATACFIVDTHINDTIGIQTELRATNPDLHCIVLFDGVFESALMNEGQAERERIEFVEKTPGLVALRVAVARAVSARA